MQDDLELIKRLQQGDSQVLSSIYDRYSGAIYGVIFRICKNEEQAQDLLQETFLKIWKKADQYNPEKGKFFTWAYRIAKNLTLNSLRNPIKLIQNEDLSVYKDEGTKEPEFDLLELNGSLKQLDPHHQKALELVYFNGLTHREAHEEMDVPLGTFKSYIKQALKKLRETYQKQLIILWVIIDLIK
ncbi:sigma-70 family RNA polymerase sigma factor [Aquimarina sp. MMG016]|uniref:RNA polymerase sigma factor n=1 Tax=Aquimarina sp. MMG016 TaxID=2822690 RepID=UPI001B3A24CC|nr:sigma-70 family RNA polymerase sigma factor [Aquimarina sp. MMG016]MBQ4822435.1 sigma-70 family RNA polymerase sigma factor [Aquimarina sp. MMG016]